MKSSISACLSLLTALALSFNAHASRSQTILNCTSTEDSDITAEVILNSVGLIEELSVTMEGEKSPVISPGNTADWDINSHRLTDTDFKKYSLLAVLERIARGPSLEVAAATAHTVSSNSGGSTSDLALIMERIMDDLAGVVMLQLNSPDGRHIGTSLIVGWGGYFKNCNYRAVSRPSGPIK